jgi:hypothetical protein
MIDQDAQLQDLPDYWQEQIRKLRVENKRLRERVNNAADLELSPRWQKTLADLRKENGKYRTERKELRAELADVRAEMEARSK